LAASSGEGKGIQAGKRLIADCIDAMAAARMVSMKNAKDWSLSVNHFQSKVHEHPWHKAYKSLKNNSLRAKA
jgi:hypothetical protein